MTPEQKHEATLLFKKNMNQRCAALGRELGFKLSLKMARATFATMLRDKGTPIAVISKLLGHASISTTEIYLASLPSSKSKEAANVLEDIWKSSEMKEAMKSVEFYDFTTTTFVPNKAKSA
jgi:integrase